MARRAGSLEQGKIVNARLEETAKEMAASEALIQKQRELTAAGQIGKGIDILGKTGTPFDAQLIGSRMADQFVAGFKALSSIPGAEAQVAQSFKTFAERAIEAGVPDIGELLSSKGFSSKQVLDLMHGLDEGTRAAVDKSTQAGQQWGNVWADEFKKYAQAAATAGAALADIQRPLDDILAKVVQEHALTVIVPPESYQAIEGIKAKLDQIPDVTRKQLVYDVYYAMSPQRPFSEFLPAMRGKFMDLDSMVRELTPEIAFNVPNLASQLREIAGLRNTIADLQHRASNPFEGGTLNPEFSRYAARFAGSQIPAIREQLSIKEFDLSSAIFQASQRGLAGGGGGGGGGPVYITLDFRGAHISQELLDRQLVPKFEQSVRMATGKEPTWEVMN